MDLSVIAGFLARLPLGVRVLVPLGAIMGVVLVTFPDAMNPWTFGVAIGCPMLAIGLALGRVYDRQQEAAKAAGERAKLRRLIASLGAVEKRWLADAAERGAITTRTTSTDATGRGLVVLGLASISEDNGMPLITLRSDVWDIITEAPIS